VFGTVDGRKGIVLQVADANGTLGTFKLTGPGNGTVNVGDDGVDIVLDQTTAASAVTVTTTAGAVFQARSLTTDSAVGTVKMPTVGISNMVTLPDGAKSLSIGTVGDGTAGSAITIGGGTVTSVLIPAVNNVTFSAAGGVRSMAVGHWTDGSISAAWIGSLHSTQNLNANLTLTGIGAPGNVALASAITGGVLGGDDTGTAGTWQVTGNIGRISALDFGAFTLNDTGILKSLTSGSGLTATIDATVIGTMVLHGSALNLTVNATTTISSVLITGDMDNSTINSGINQAGTIGSLRVTGMGVDDTVTSGFNTSPAAERSDGVIRSLFFGGAVDSTSRFLAATLPKKPIIDGAAVDPATDPRFQN
jgi:hypothetical protein